MNIIEKQTELGQSLYQINTSTMNDITELGRKNIEQYFDVNRTFGERLPEVREISSFLSLQREYGETLWNNAKEAIPSTLTSINNFGLLLEAQGKMTEAEPYLREALQTSRRIMGNEHPSTLISISNMGAFLNAQGKMTEAERRHAGTQDNDDADQTDDHGNPARHANAFPQHRNRQRGDQQRGGEEQGIGLRQGQLGKGEEGADHGREHGDGARGDEPGVARPQVGNGGVGGEGKGHRDERKQHRKKDDLEHGVVGSEQLDEGVMGGEDAERGDGEQHAAISRPVHGTLLSGTSAPARCDRRPSQRIFGCRRERTSSCVHNTEMSFSAHISMARRLLK